MYVKTAVGKTEEAETGIEHDEKGKRCNVVTPLLLSKRTAPTGIGVHIVATQRTNESNECIFFVGGKLQLLWLATGHQPRIEVVVASSIDAVVMIDDGD
jgi:hypothetical protein